MHILWGGSRNPEINDALAAWCAHEIGMTGPFERPYTTMGVFEGETLVAVVVYNNFHPEAGTIEFHGAGITPRWLSRHVLKAMFSYPFEQIGCQMVVTRNSANNKRLHRQLKAYGFKHVTIPRLRGRDEAESIFWLTEEAWRANGFHKESVMERPSKSCAA